MLYDTILLWFYRGGGKVEWASENYLEQVDSAQLSLLYIQASQQSCIALQLAAQRIRRNVRSNDTVLLLDTNCIIVLPDATVDGAQVVARRIYALLADVEFELQILCDDAALALLQRLQCERTINAVEKEEGRPQLPTSMVRRALDGDELPYLAFLASYPSHRLLHLFPYELACRHHCVPVGAERGVLTLATCRSFDHELIVQFRNITQRNIFQVRCEASMIDDILKYWRRTMFNKEEKSDSQHV